MTSGKTPVWLFVLAGLFVLGAWRGVPYLRERFERSSAETNNAAAKPYIDAARKRANDAKLEVRAAIVKAHAAPLVAEGACPLAVPPPPPMNGNAKTSFDNANEAVNAALGGDAYLHRMTTVSAKELDGLEAAGPKNLAWKAGAVEGSSTLASFVDDAKKLENEKLTWDLVLVRDEWKVPIADDATKTFTPGRFKGRGYLYDHGKHAVVCAAEVDATNSDNVKFKIGEHIAATALFQDLDAEALRQAVEKLAAVK